MTKIAMLFTTTTGIPIGGALVEIRLTRSDYDEAISGVLMTRLEDFHTDVDGNLLVDLAPCPTLYHVTVYDTVQDIAIHHDFYVPVVEDPNTVLRLQDLIVPPDTHLSSMPFDETAMLAIIAARNVARDAALQAQASAATAVTAAATAVEAIDTVQANTDKVEAWTATVDRQHTEVGGWAIQVAQNKTAVDAAVIEVNQDKDEAVNAAAGAKTSETNAVNSAVAARTDSLSATASKTAAAASATAASGSQTGAANSAAAALASQTSATQSATTATTAATTATTAKNDSLAYKDQAFQYMTSAQAAKGSAEGSATAALVSANSATASATTATGAATTATAARDVAVDAKNKTETAWTDFDKRYFGAFAASPTVNSHGTAPVVGSLYWNTTTNSLFTWTGAAWYEISLAYRTTQNRKILVLGSSVAAGYGSPTFNGWAQRLGAALVSYGYTMVNKAIGGNKTTDCINRFYTDVVPENPAIVILGLSLANEGLVGPQKEVVYSQYIKNMLRLVQMCREMGYKVIVTGVYSNNDYTAADYPYLIQADQELENSDIPYINFLGAVDDGTGHWRTGLWSDSGHPNDTGHEALFRAFPLSLFDNLSSGRSMTPAPVNPNVMKMTGMALGTVPAVYTSESPFGSFTVMARIRRTTTGAASKPLICMELTSGAYSSVRIRNTLDAIMLSFEQDDRIVSTVLTSTNEELCIIFSFDYYTNTWRLWIDGVLIGSTIWAYTSATNYDQVAFGGRTNYAGFDVNGYEFRDMAVWRTALTAEQVAEATAGRINKASLNMYSPVVDVLVPNGSRLINLAPSSTFSRVAAVGISTYPYNQVTSKPKALAQVKTKDSGFIDIALLDPTVPFASLEVRSASSESVANSYLRGGVANTSLPSGTYSDVLRLGVSGQSGFNFSGSWIWRTSAGTGNSNKLGYKLSLRNFDTSTGTYSAELLTVSGTGQVYMPLLKAGTANTVNRHDIKHVAAQAAEILSVGREGSAQPCVVVNGSDGVAGWAGAASVLYVGKNATTNRAISTPGTVNAQGTDYAEYFVKNALCGVIAAGQIIGITRDNQITDKWSEAVMLAIKSSDPSFVGGDNWAKDVGHRPSPVAGIEPVMPVRIPDEMGQQESVSDGPIEVVVTAGDTDEEWEAKMVDHNTAVLEWLDARLADQVAMADFDAKLEIARDRVDRIAIAGRVPVNVMGAEPGDYIVPVQDGSGIKGVAVKEDDMTLRQYMRAVGQVITIESDGRAYVMVKSV